LAVFITGTSVAATVKLPDGTLTIPGGSASGASFTYAGTLTEGDTLALAQTGNACLQPKGGYCTNGAGVITVAATLSPKPVGAAITFAGPAGIIPAGTWTYGSVLMSISGVGTVQLWSTIAGNGLGSAKPPASLNLRNTTLAGLGFGNFSVTNPTITFIVADANFGDNSGQFVLTQTGITDVSDLWWDPTESGWGMQLVNTGAFAFATVYVYGQDGKPFWLSGPLPRARIGPLTYSGNVVVTTGPYFGGPFNPDNVTRTVAGTMTFVLTTADTGLLTYTVDGVTVNKEVQRQPLTLDDYSGEYVATDTRVTTGCLDAANNGTFTFPATVEFTHSGQAMSAEWTLGNAGVCTHTGTYSQLGRMGTFVADYTCTSGEVGTATWTEMTSSLGIFKARLQTHSTNLGCTTTGRVLGVIPG